MYFSDGRGEHIAGLARMKSRYGDLSVLSAPAEIWQPRRRRWGPVEAFVVEVLGTGDWRELPADLVERSKADLARRLVAKP